MEKYVIRILHVSGVLEGLITQEVVTASYKSLRIGVVRHKTSITNSSYVILSRRSVKQ